MSSLSVFSLYVKEFPDLVLFHVVSYYAQASGDLCRAFSHIRLSRNIVKMYPLSVLAFYYALGSEYHAVGFLIVKGFQGFLYGLLGELPGSFYPYAVKDFVGMMVVMMIVSAAAVIMIVVVVMFMFMIVVMMMVVAALAVIVMIMVVAMLMVMMVVIVMVVIVVVVMFFCQMVESFFYGVFPLHGV